MIKHIRGALKLIGYMFTLTGAVIFSGPDVFADTPVPTGTYTLDEILEMGEYPYILSDNVVINGGTLNGQKYRSPKNQAVFDINEGNSVTFAGGTVTGFRDDIFHVHGSNSHLLIEGGSINGNKGRAVYLTSEGEKVSFEMEGGIISSNDTSGKKLMGAGIVAVGAPPTDDAENSSIDIRINGTEISGNKTYESSSDQPFAGFGGGLSISGYVKCTLSNTKISGNSAYRGGGCFFGDDCIVTLDENVGITGNTAANYGGGIDAEGCTISVKQSTLNGNSAYRGGGLCYYRSTGPDDTTPINISDSSVSENIASHGGAGIYLRQGGCIFDGDILLENNKISGANGYAFGPAIYMSQGEAEALLSSSDDANISISGNKSENSSSYGGAIMILGNSRAVLKGNWTFKENDAGVSGKGGGIYINSALPCKEAMLELSGTVTFDKNTAAEGGCIYAYETSVRADASSIVTMSGNTATSGGGLYSYKAGFEAVKGANLLILDNSASSCAGLSFYDSDALLHGEMVVRGNIATSNTGGGLYFYDTEGGHTMIIDSKAEISENQAKSGGGICVRSGVVTLGSEVNITKNIAATYGSGIFVHNADALCIIDGSRVTENTSDSASYFAGGIMNFSGTLVLKGSPYIYENFISKDRQSNIYINNANRDSKLQHVCVDGALREGSKVGISAGYDYLVSGTKLVCPYDDSDLPDDTYKYFVHDRSINNESGAPGIGFGANTGRKWLILLDEANFCMSQDLAVYAAKYSGDAIDVPFELYINNIRQFGESADVMEAMKNSTFSVELIDSFGAKKAEDIVDIADRNYSNSSILARAISSGIVRITPSCYHDPVSGNDTPGNPNSCVYLAVPGDIDHNGSIALNDAVQLASVIGASKNDLSHFADDFYETVLSDAKRVGLTDDLAAKKAGSVITELGFAIANMNNIDDVIDVDDVVKLVAMIRGKSTYYN